jgi:hypothetical protein
MAQFSFWESQTFESQITAIPSSYLAANQNFTHSCKKLPSARTVLGVYLRVNLDLGPDASTGYIRFDDEDSRGKFFGNLISSITRRPKGKDYFECAAVILGQDCRNTFL